MKFPTPLIRARLIKRYKRFLADVELPDGAIAVAHCPNPGAMTGLAEPGQYVWLEPNNDPKKKLDLGWRLSELSDGSLVCIDTMIANKVVGEALENYKINDLTGYEMVRREVKYGQRSRIDFLLEGAGTPNTFVEVKSVTLSRGNRMAEFPDTISARASKHMAELASVVRSGHRAVLLYLVQRSDCEVFEVAADVDPKYAEAVQRAKSLGLEILCFKSNITEEGITLGSKVWHN